ncbi:MAG: PhnD/SsuA/transferrin family substrate-binding protein, partial [Pseudogulbenkiania sp.]|nr:PhnD/SsuA/transferrin family substrate-binding protein [Pseudogulbenkiania sp.]
IAFEDPYSTSAFVLPLAELAQQGLTAVPKAQAGANSVGYVFAEQELNQAFLVAEKRTDAGAFNNNDWDKLPVKLQAELRIVHRTRPILRWLACFSPRTPARLRQAVESALLGMEGQPEGLKALAADHIKRVERMTSDDRASLDYVRHIVATSGR